VASGGTESVDILLTPKTGGANGSLSYQIQINFAIEEATAFITTPEGEAVDSFGVIYGDTGFGGTGGYTNQGSRPLPPGEYQIRLRIQQRRYYITNPAIYAGFTEVFHIYSGLATVLPFKNFVLADFSEAISDLDLTDLVTPPVAWASPVHTFAGTDQYSGLVYWYESDGVTPVSGRDIFAVNTVYKAVVRLETKTGYNLIGVAENSFAHDNATSVVNEEDAGIDTSQVGHVYGYVTITFPATDSPAVTSVTVTPSTATVLQGGQQSFSAVVAGELGGNSYTTPQDVTWSVSGNSSTGTNITSAGLLTVATDEAASTVTVRATPIADTAFTSGEATVTVTPLATYIEIDDATELAQIGVDTENYPLGGKYKLMANLTLADWVPLGSNTAPFLGIFDGNNKTITLQSFASAALSGNSYLGIFGYIAGSSSESRAELKDLAIASSVADTSTASTGPAVGLLAGYVTNADISNITLSGTLGFQSADVSITVGGIAGIASSGVYVEDCNGSVAMNITAGSQGATVGGFAGSIAGDIINCHATGNITVSAASAIYCGGIAGTLTGTIEKCSFIATSINATVTVDTYAQPHVGGIAGSISGNSSSITGCWAEGIISGTAPSNNVRVGGVGGDLAAGGKIAQSYFNGTVNSVSNHSTATSKRGYAGGIAGVIANYAAIEDCWSHGKVNGDNTAGGIAGMHQNPYPSYIRRCYSTSEVTRTVTTESTTVGAGGISGTNRNTTDVNTTIISCAALNSKISGVGSTYIHRIVGRTDAGVLTGNNHAWSGMTIDSGSATYTADIGADKVDGATLAAQPVQTFYEGLGWDFTATTGVWEMDSSGYPKLQWQAAEIARSPL
jgi:hypothetical protein